MTTLLADHNLERQARLLLVTFSPQPLKGISLLAPIVKIALAGSSPHRRGDSLEVVDLPAYDLGSPPRLWGRLLLSRRSADRRQFTPRLWGRYRLVAASPRRIRFTPTPMGTISPRACSVLMKPVHPYACGDNATYIYEVDTYVGSPPRLWDDIDATIEYT